MKNITCIIVDDEIRARNVLQNLLEKQFPHLQVLAQCKNVLDAVEQINIHQPDVVFLDVQMPNYAGYELVNFFKEIKFEIIFITAHDKYAIKAFELSAIDYLVKPINRSRLSESIEKLKLKLDRTNKIHDYQVLLDSLKQEEFDSIILPVSGNKKLIKISHIHAIEANGSYAIVHLKDSKKIVLSKNLTYFESILPEDGMFYRSHRGWIINLKSIESYNKSNHELQHTCGLKTSVSRSKVAEFENKLYP